MSARLTRAPASLRALKELSQCEKQRHSAPPMFPCSPLRNLNMDFFLFVLQTKVKRYPPNTTRRHISVITNHPPQKKSFESHKIGHLYTSN